jgi:hypothetical protein
VLDTEGAPLPLTRRMKGQRLRKEVGDELPLVDQYSSLIDGTIRVANALATTARRSERLMDSRTMAFLTGSRSEGKRGTRDESVESNRDQHYREHDQEPMDHPGGHEYDHSRDDEPNG